MQYTLLMEKIMPLFDVKPGRVGVLARIDGVEKNKHKRLIELGFYEGARLEVLVRRPNIAIVGVRGYAMSLDRTLMEKILVYGGER